MKVSPCLATAMCFRGQSRFGVFFSQEKTLAKSRILDAANPAKGGMRLSGDEGKGSPLTSILSP